MECCDPPLSRMPKGEPLNLLKNVLYLLLATGNFTEAFELERGFPNY